MNHWHECIDICFGAFLGQADSSLFKSKSYRYQAIKQKEQ